MDMYPIKIDVSKLSYPLVVYIVSPLLPGGVLLLGVALTHSDYILRFLQLAALGYYFKIFLILLVAYACGFLLKAIIEIVSALFWGWLNFATHSAISNWIIGRHPSENQTFRKAAAQLLGKAAPTFQEVFNPIVSKIENIQIELIKDPSEKVKAMTDLSNRHAAIQLSDIEWRSWYEAFKRYFGLPNDNHIFPVHLASVIGSLGWAGILVLIFSSGRYLSLYLVCIVCILIGMMGSLWSSCIFGGFGTDVLESDVTAALLREVVAHPRTAPEKTE